MESIDDMIQKFNTYFRHVIVERSSGNEEFVLDGRKMLTKATALKELYTCLGFKNYIEYANYDGLDELLRPASDAWPQRKGLDLCITNSRVLLAKGERDVTRMLFNILDSAAYDWNRREKNSFTLTLRA